MDEEYLRDLALKETTFVSEYRLGLGRRSMPKSKSKLPGSKRYSDAKSVLFYCEIAKIFFIPSFPIERRHSLLRGKRGKAYKLASSCAASTPASIHHPMRHPHIA
jgi:hypothetical protein